MYTRLVCSVILAFVICVPSVVAFPPSAAVQVEKPDHPKPIDLTPQADHADDVPPQVEPSTDYRPSRGAPIADAGGPYIAEAEDRVDGGWLFTFDGSGSSADGSIVSWQWDFGPETFDGTWLNTYEWQCWNTYQDDQLVTIGNGHWGHSYAFSNRIVVREQGVSVRARVTHSGGHAVWGFKSANDDVHQNQIRNGFYLHDNGVYLWQGGGTFGPYGSYTPNQPVDLRIDLKPGQGARYYIKAPSESWEGHLVYESEYASDTELRVGSAVHSGSFKIDDLHILLGGELIDRKVYRDGFFTLTVEDESGQRDSVGGEVVVLDRDLIVDSGGPYTGTQDTLDGYGWTFSLDASGSSSAFEIVDYRWDLGTERFSGPWLNVEKWQCARAFNDDAIVVYGDGHWAHSYAFANRLTPRGPGHSVQARVTPGSGHAVWGLKLASDSFHPNQIVYGLYTHDNGVIDVYQEGSASATGVTFTPGESYDFRIETKPINGARYYMRLAGEEEWQLISDANHSSVGEFQLGVTVHSGSYRMDDVTETVWGEIVDHKMYWGQPATLTVTDSGGQIASQQFEILVDPDVPTADAGGPYSLAEDAYASGGWTFDFDGAYSTSGHGLVAYEWDFGFDTFDESGEIDHSLHKDARGWKDNGWLSISGNGHWGHGHVYQNQVLARTPDALFQARVQINSGIHVLGLVDPESTTFVTSHIQYCFYFQDNNVRIYENGADRGVVGSYTSDDVFDLRIVLKDPVGAYYYWRPAGETEWTLAYDSLHGSAREFLPGVTCHSGAISVDEWSIRSYGQQVQRKVPGTTDVTLTVIDAIGQRSSESASIDVVGDDPVADSGGPYFVDETAFLTDHVEDVVFDGSGSTDDFGIVAYEWDLGTDTVDGALINDLRWYHSGATKNNRMQVAGASNWSNRYAYSKQIIQRGPGAAFDCEVIPTVNHAVVGLKNTTTDFHRNQLTYGLYFNEGTLTVYEDGSSRGNVGSYVPGTAYQVRIELKEEAGAFYWIREVGEDDWTPIYDSYHSTATEFLRGITVHSGTFIIDNMRELFSGETISYRASRPLVGSLTVRDRAGHSDTDVVELAVFGEAPIANACGPYIAPLGSVATLSAAGSGDDLGIELYSWESDEGAIVFGNPAHMPFDTIGLHEVTLTVVDAAGQNATDTTTVEVMPMVACIPWDYDNVSGLEVPHNTWDGLNVRLKAVAYTDTLVDELEYTWSFGDGSDDETGLLSSKRSIETYHVYEGAPGAVYHATITIHDPVYGDLADTYPVMIHERDLTIEVNVAIDEAIWWLHGAQSDNGSWASYQSYVSGSTASPVHAMEINGHVPSRSVADDPLVEDVVRGLDFLVGQLQTHSISVQPAGDPDSNANGIGIGVSGNRPIYETGMVVDALSASSSPDMMPAFGPLNIRARTYRGLVQDMLDMYAYGLEDSGAHRGGWRYSWNSDADNSAAQWGAIAFLGAKAGFGLDAPEWVKSENNIWLNYSYNGIGFSYQGGTHGEAVTPCGMVQLAFAGFTTTDSRWQTAESWMANNWQSWMSTNNNVYAWYAFAKAMRVALPEPVAELAATGLDWYHGEDGLIRYILDRQEPAGNWPDYYGPVFATAWQTVILTPTLFTRPPVAQAGNDVVWAFDLPLTFDGSNSYHTDPVRVLVEYEWDFEGDGVYDYVGSDPAVDYTYVFDAGIVYPQTYTARLRVTDDIGQTDTDTRTVIIAEPPHAPFAVAGGPYSASEGVALRLDPSGSYDIDPTDYITRIEWDFDGSDGYDFDNPDAVVECVAPAEGMPQTDGCPAIEWIFPSLGTHNIALRVWDSGVLNEPTGDSLPSLPDFTTVIVGVNEAPVADAGGPYEGDECTFLQLDGTGSADPNGDGLSYSWDLDGDGDYSDSEDPAPSFTWSDDGDYVVGLIVSDGAMFSEPSYANVTVYDTEPAITIAGPSALAIGQQGTFEATVTADCDDISLIEWDWDYNGFTFFASGDEGATQHHSFDVQGDYVIAALATDEDGSTAFATFSVAVDPPQGPRLPAGERIRVIVGRRDYDAVTQTHRGQFTLVSEHDQPITGPIALAFASMNPASVALVDPDGYVSHPETGDLVPHVDFSHLLTDNALLPGESVGPLWIEFSDPQGVAFTFDAMAYLFNAPPRIISTPIVSATEGVRYAYDVDVVDDDGDDVLIELRSMGSPIPDGMTINLFSGLIDWVPGQTDEGEHEVTVVASDGLSGGETVQIFTITVGGVNVAPVIISEPDTTALVDEEYTYQVEAYDPDGDSIEFDLSDAPSGMTIDPADGAIAWTPEESGLFYVEVVVVDSFGNDSFQTFRITVGECVEPPTILSSPVLVGVEGEPYSYRVQAVGVGVLTYALAVAPDGMTIDSSGLVYWEPSFDDHGLRTVKVVVSGGGDHCQTEQVFQIDVEDANIAPIFVTDPIEVAAEGEQYIYAAQAVDLDNDSVAYSLVEGPEGMAIHALVGRVSWIPSQTAGAFNPHVVTIRATDSLGYYDQQTFEITVDAHDQAPTIVSAPNYEAIEGEVYQYSVEAVDPDDDPLEFSLASGPDGMTIGLSSGLVSWEPSDTAAELNPYPVRIVVSDPGGNTASQAFSIYVRKTNLAPEITSDPVTEAIEGEVYVYVVQATDADNDTINYTLLTSPSGMGIHPLGGRIDWLVPQTAASDGPHEVTVAATDGLETVTQTFFVEAAEVNVAPIVFSDPVTEAAVGALYEYAVVASDLDEDVLAYRLDEAPSGMNIDETTGLVSWTPEVGQDGEHPVSIVVSDPLGLTATQEFTLETAPCADAPQFVSSPKTTASPNVLYEYSVEAIAPSGIISYQLVVAPVGMTIVPESGLITWTPDLSQLGIQDVTVLAIRDEVCPTQQAFQIDVRECDIAVSYHQPTLVPGWPATFVPVVEANCEPLSYSFLSGAEGMTINPTTGMIRWIAEQGPFSAEVQVVDGWGTVASVLLGGEVLPETPPRIISVPEYTAQVDVAYEYQVVAEDDEDDDIEFSFVSAPAGMSVDADSGLVSWTPTIQQIGSHNVEIKADDQRGWHVVQGYVLTVSEFGDNHPPTITSEPGFVAAVGCAYEYQVVATDVDTDALSYSMDEAPAGASIDSDSGLLTWTPVLSQVGQQSVAVRVDDGRGGWALQTFGVTVSIHGDNQSPVITSIPSTTAAANASYVYAVEATDPDGDVLSYALDSAPMGMTINASGVLQWTPSTDQMGVHDVVVRVADGRGGASVQSFNLTVSEYGDNNPPRIVSSPPVVAQVDEAYTYQVVGVDDDGDALTYSLTVAPEGMTIGESSGLVEWTPDVSQIGTHNVDLVVSDDSQASAGLSFTVTVSVDGLNHAPEITSSALTTVVAGTEYSYEVMASDADDDAITFSLESAPSGMTIDSVSGLVSFLPTEAEAGEYPIHLRVTDTQDAWADQRFSLLVRINSAPQIVSSPVLRAIAELPYAYSVVAIDPDDFELSYELTTAPEGMAIDQSSGLISWIPSVEQAGDHEVALIVRDGLLAQATQEFSVSVFDDPNADIWPPEVFVTVDPVMIDLGEAVTISVEAIDDFAVASVDLTINDEPLMLDSNGQAVFTPEEADVYVARATVTDLVGHISRASADFFVRTPGDETPPTVAITSPAMNSEVTEPTEIVGIVTDDNLFKYTLAYRVVGDDEYVELHTGYAAVEDDVLATLDPTMMPNGMIELRLRAFDTNGNVSTIVSTCAIDGSMKVGNFTVSYVDLQVPLVGIPITVTRSYDSRDKTKGDFGVGWKLGLASTQVQENKTFGENWEQILVPGFGGLNTYVLTPVDAPIATVTLPDGRVERFMMSVEPMQQMLLPVHFFDRVVFTPLGNTNSSLRVLGDTSGYYDGGTPGFGNIYFYSSNSPADPNGYELTLADGSTYTFAGNWQDSVSGLQSVEDRNDNQLQFMPNGIFHSSGVSVAFDRDDEGRITTVRDPDNNEITFTYDERGDLVSVTNAAQNTTEFVYNADHDLISIVDPRGLMPARNIYDDDGRLVATVDTAGNRIEYEHNMSSRQEVIRDFLGNPTVHEYDSNGNILASTDALGHRYEWTYDDRGNVLTEKDADDKVTTFTYDQDNNLLTAKDCYDQVTTFTYDSFGNVLTTTDPLGNVTTSVYDDNGNLLSTTDAMGNVSQFTYDSSGNMISATDSMGRVSSIAYDSAGRPIESRDSAGRVTSTAYNASGRKTLQEKVRVLPGGGEETVTQTFLYDDMNRLTKVIDSDGGETISEYNEIEKIAATIDQLGHRTEYEYNERGQRVRTVYHDGSEQTYGHDVMGRLTKAVDRSGRETSYEYDAIGQKTKEFAADGTMVQWEYDVNGRVTRVLNELGHPTQYRYDALGRKTAVVDALGNTTAYEYDANGQMTAVIDALTRRTEFRFDSLGRRVGIDFADGTSTTIEYNSIGAKVAESDQAGKTTQFEYDDMGNLTRVVDAAGQETSYSYVDSALTPANGSHSHFSSDLSAQINGELHATQFEYDNMRRVTQRTLPLGMSESRNYNFTGNLVSKVDFNGQTIGYEYDEYRRLTQKTLPGDDVAMLTYTPSHQRKTVTDSHGITSYTYDLRDRILSKTDPDGATISYLYDDAGNRTSVTTPAGTTIYSYDELNRLETVTDPDGGTTTYGYDQVGNRTSVTYPNDTKTSYAYDELYRLVYMETVKVSTAEVIATYTYTLGAAGNRLRVEESSGRIVEYEYDDVYRLTLERITDEGGETTAIVYTYDAVGNRLSKTETTDSEVVTTVYSYDDNERLTTQATTRRRAEAASVPEMRYVCAHQTSGGAAFLRDGFVVVSVLMLLTPTALLHRRGRSQGVRALRRRTFVQSIALLMVPIFVLTPEVVLAASVEAKIAQADQLAMASEAHARGAITYAYDDNGNMLSRTDGVLTDTYTYDAEDRLISADIQIGDEPGYVTYTYDVDGIRTSKTVDGVTTRYLVDTARRYAQVVLETTGDQSVSYVYGDDLISMTRPETGRVFYHYNGHGSVVQLSDAAGTVTDQYTYDAFGQLLTQVGSTLNNYLYTGEQYDANVGFYYLRARYMDPSTGRFTSMDTYGGSVFDPPSLHKYAYANNNPVNGIDPSGHATLLEVMVVVAIILLLVTYTPLARWTHICRTVPVDVKVDVHHYRYHPATWDPGAFRAGWDSMKESGLLSAASIWNEENIRLDFKEHAPIESAPYAEISDYSAGTTLMEGLYEAGGNRPVLAFIEGPIGWEAGVAGEAVGGSVGNLFGQKGALVSLSYADQYVPAHELGHIFGLSHNSQKGSLMWGNLGEMGPGLLDSEVTIARQTIEKYHWGKGTAY